MWKYGYRLEPGEGEIFMVDTEQEALDSAGEDGVVWRYWLDENGNGGPWEMYTPSS